MEFDAPYRHDPNHPMNPPTAGMLRQIPIDRGNGVIEMEDERALLRSSGEEENDNEIVAWVEYRLPGANTLVHRSVHVHLKKALVFGEAIAAAMG